MPKLGDANNFSCQFNINAGIPVTPDAGFADLYVDSDKKLYLVDDTGTVTGPFGETGAVGVPHVITDTYTEPSTLRPSTQMTTVWNPSSTPPSGRVQYGLYVDAGKDGTETAPGTSRLVSAGAYAQVIDSGTVESVFAFEGQADNNGGGTVTNSAAFYARKAFGTITNVYGLYVQDQNQGTNNYSIYTNAGDVRLMSTGSDKLGVHGATPIAQQTVTGSRGGNAALADLLTKLANIGLIVDGTSA